MTAILGISAFYHDSAAALVIDGEIVAAAQEERFTRKKQDSGFPENAVAYCVREAGLRVEDLDYVAFYDKPLRKFDRLLETYLSFAPSGLQSFAKAMPLWLREKLRTPKLIDDGLGGEFKKRYAFLSHHESHAASAFFPSPYESASILTMDGVGEWSTASLAVGRGNRIEMLRELRFPHSLGLLYSAFTYFTGFRVNSGEYKLMGLAPYGEPKYADTILEKLIDLKEDGSFRLDMSYFNYCTGLTMTSSKMDQLFGGPRRKPESPLSQREMDLAASIQRVTEEVVMRMAAYAKKETGLDNLCLAGGVALNCVANGKLLRDGPFKNMWIQPAAGDAGGALGAATFVWYQLMDNERGESKTDRQRGSFLGPKFSNDEIKTFLEGQGAKYERYDDLDALLDRVTDLLGEERVIGWMQGRMEFGPRALGGRSIIGDARSREMQQVMNVKIKFRESFRPFAPSVLNEYAHEYFAIREDQESPYMLLVADVHRDKLLEVDNEGEGLDKLKTIRSVVPAITHVDYSARVQSVDAERNPRYHALIERFRQKNGVPLVINTSFNVRGEPIVCTPEDAYRCFMGTGMDVLVLEDFVLLKEDQPDATAFDVDAYIAQFPLD